MKLSLRRKQAQFSDEISQGLDHLRNAATLAAGRMGEAVGPTAHRARRAARGTREGTLATFSPMYTAAMEGVNRAAAEAEKASKSAGKTRKEAKRRAKNATLALRGETKRRYWPWVAGALVIGAGAGIIGALVMRRRGQTWEDYEPEHIAKARDAVKEKAQGAKDSLNDAKDKAKDSINQAKDKISTKAGQASDAIADKTKDATDAVRSGARSAADSASSAASTAASKSGTVTDQVAAGVRSTTSPNGERGGTTRPM